MDLHAIVGPYVAKVNPWLMATWRQSTGSVKEASGKRTPTYATVQGVRVQCQALQFKDLVQLEGLNINGVKQALYVDGNIEGVSRPDARGGDMFTLPDGSIWLVVLPLENWARTAGWSKVAVVLQNDTNQ